jgi:hypothetical protein
MRRHRRHSDTTIDERSFPGDALLESALRAEAEDDLADLALPQVVCVYDRVLDRLRVFGPFASTAEAVAFGARFEHDLDDGDGDAGIELVIAPLTSGS